MTHRVDADRNEIQQMKEKKESLGSDWYNIWREYKTTTIPDKAVVWPFSTKEEIGWGPKIEIKIPKLD
mgnify:CR=1 FL=1